MLNPNQPVFSQWAQSVCTSHTQNDAFELCLSPRCSCCSDWFPFFLSNQLLSDYQSTTLYRGKSYITIAEDPSLMNAVLLYVKMLHICCHACHVGSCDATSLINVLMSIKKFCFLICTTVTSLICLWITQLQVWQYGCKTTRHAMTSVPVLIEYYFR